MHHMTFTEETDEKIKIQLSLYANDKNKVFIEMHPEGHDFDNYYEYQCMVLGRRDTEILIKELQRIIDEYEIKD